MIRECRELSALADKTTCYSSATSFVDGGISLKNGGKPFFVNSKLLVDTGALMPSGIAISEDFFFQGMGGGQ